MAPCGNNNMVNSCNLWPHIRIFLIWTEINPIIYARRNYMQLITVSNVNINYWAYWSYVGLCGLVIRVPGYTTEKYCVSCEVQTEFICYVEESRPPLWSNGQSSWLQILRSGFDFQRYQIFWEVVGLERGPLSLVSTTEELLERKSCGYCLESREYGRGNPSCCPRGTLYAQKLALSSPKSGGRSVGIVRSRTQATELAWILLKTPVF
jgi:hypothetical protein